MKNLILKVIFIHALFFYENILMQSIQWQPGNWAFACDFPGDDIQNVLMPGSGANCGPTCQKKSGCTHFTWNTYNGGTCWLKSAPVTKAYATFTGDYSAVCGIIIFSNSPIQWQPGNWAFACDFPGDNIQNIPMPGSGANCGPTCQKKSGCTHFTWNTYNGGTCWLKSAPVTKAYATFTGDYSAVCGIIIFSNSSIQWQPGNWAYACDFLEGDIQNIPMPGSGANCGPTCQKKCGCTHITWNTYNGGTCWMKSGTVSKSDAIFTGDYSAVCAIASSSSTKIQWQPGNWAYSCDFMGNNLTNVLMPASGAQCGPKCTATSGCTHYTW